MRTKPCAKSLNHVSPRWPIISQWAKEMRNQGDVAKAATFLVREVCARASNCARVCERFVKGLGKLAYCVDAKTGAKVLLYEALEKEEFACPKGLF